MQAVKRILSYLFSSNEEKEKNSLQWVKLESKNSDDMPSVRWWKRIFISHDHMIVLIEDSDQVHTFHLRDLYWSKHAIKKHSIGDMSFSSCLVRPGLIVDLIYGVLLLLTFETEKDPQNFHQRARRLDISQHSLPSAYTITADQKSIYLFGCSTEINSRDANGSIYRVSLESYQVSELKAEGLCPSPIANVSTMLEDDKLFIFAESDPKGTLLSELWVFNISQMKWEKLSDKSSQYVPKGRCKILVKEGQIYLYDNGCSLLLSWSWNECRWKTFGSVPNNTIRKAITFYEDSFILLDGSEVSYLQDLERERKTKKSKPSKLEDFLTKLETEKAFADVIFQVENEEFPANKCILATRSLYFNKLFTS